MKVEEDLCIGCGSCSAIAPDVFEMTDEGLAKVILDPIPDELMADAKEAQESCPTGAIVDK